MLRSDRSVPLDHGKNTSNHDIDPDRREDLTLRATLFNNDILIKRGLAALFEDASNQRAGRIGLFNTNPALREVEEQSILRARQVQLAAYNDYRAHCRYPRVTEFDQISGDPEIQQALRRLYGDVDHIELYVGLFAEDLRPSSALPPLIGRMVGIDAFSQILTNPLLAPRIFNERTFSPLGMRLIQETNTLSEIVHRNVSDTSRHYFVGLTRRGWRRDVAANSTSSVLNRRRVPAATDSA
ncbi:MAG: hypothetical protein LC791_11530 [Acidobacteria bacterium]|nr:hypothetical protein [Acidobacteriota bacterium]